jgi:phospholipid/cholesterol/gamma-HCH transport system substrate-binding protein
VPSQKQLRWAELRVGLTVVFASIVLMFLIFLMGGSAGFFSPTLQLYTYVQDASGLRNGAPVRLQNVDIGNVQKIRIVDHHAPSGASTPVQIAMKINAKFRPFVHTDSQVMLTTAGVLGETYIDIDSTHAKGGPVSNHAELQAQEVPDMQDVLKSSQGTLENVNILVKRLDRIVSAVEDQKGSVGQLIYDKQLYNNLNSSVKQVNGMLTDINNGRGSLGKLLNDDTLYNRASATIDKLNTVADNVNHGQGTIGKLIQDPSLYDNANQTLAKANSLMDGINRGEGGLGMMAKDKEFAKKLNSLVTNLSTISEELQAGKGSAGKLLKDPALYNNVDNLLLESRNLVAAIRKDPKKYLTIRLKIF